MKHTITTAGKVSLKLTAKQMTALSFDISHTNDLDLSEATCQNFQYLVIQRLSFNKFNKVDYNYKKIHSVALEPFECAALANNLPIDESPLCESIGDYLQDVLKELDILFVAPQPQKEENES
ncbi:hypothetical protein WAF17_20990 [Bernardetia sp. ABR2-2B]|uniref:hypothetical protein n=1 Tax=Bernardetia sp. ABR2-2B TaxID=3127472 RepID=UPI0030D082D4